MFKQLILISLQRPFASRLTSSILYLIASRRETTGGWFAMMRKYPLTQWGTQRQACAMHDLVGLGARMRWGSSQRRHIAVVVHLQLPIPYLYTAPSVDSRFFAPPGIDWINQRVMHPEVDDRTRSHFNAGCAQLSATRPVSCRAAKQRCASPEIPKGWQTVALCFCRY